MTDPNMPGVHTELGAGVKPDTKQMAYEVVKAARAAGHPLYFVWGNGPTGDHKAGIAVDFMVYDQGTTAKPGKERPEVGKWVADYVWTNRKRLGVRYEIFSRRIRSTTGTPPNVWLKYTGDDPHTNHVHVSRLTNAPKYQPPAVVKPVPKLWLSQFLAARSDIPHGREVKLHPLTVQTAEYALRDFGFNPGPIDGHYGTATDEAVRAFQMLVSGKADGKLGPKEWERLAGGPKDGKHGPRFIPEIGNLPKS